MNSKSHILPFAVWLGVMALLQLVDSSSGIARICYPVSYAAKSVLCAVLFFMLKPWRGYKGLALKNAMAGAMVGVLVFVLWVLPETELVREYAPRFQEFYYRFLVMPFGSMPEYFSAKWFPEPPPGHLSWAYAPQEAGWFLTIAKLMGSGLVIAALEEFFFRGYLYRRIQDEDFDSIPLRSFSAGAFFLTVLIFSVEHDRFLAGAMAGIAYGLLAVRSGCIWSCVIAHGVTNTLLGVYVICTKSYGFW